MKTDKITVFDLFEKQRRYLVPIFQRGYVWTKEQQWEPLWEDVFDQAKVVQHGDGSARNTIRKHFLGTIVLSHVPTVIKQVPSSEIIDGQQRLLTLQVLLTAFKDVIADLDDEHLKMQLKILTGNIGPFQDEIEQYKVWPTNAYQQDIKNILTAGSSQKLAAIYPQKMYRRKLVPPLPALVEAYFYYSGVISQFLGGAEDEDVPKDYRNTPELLKERANILFEAVMRYIQLVEIQLDAEDDPQVIFESLNYRGVPLEPYDIIRNFIFLYASRNNKDVNALYSQYWKDYDEATGTSGKFWKEKERQGRIFRSRLDLFFFHYLTYQVGREIKMGHIYQEFKDWWDSPQLARSIEFELEAAKHSSQVFRSIIAPDDTNIFGAFATRLRILDTTTIYPLLLWLCVKRDNISAGEFDGILSDLESYIIRRLVCGLTPKNYNRTFLSLLGKLIKEGSPNRELLRRELLLLEGDSAIWPNNDVFFQRLVFQPLYELLGPRRSRMLLTALELGSRSQHQESALSPVKVDNNLTVEHIMPRGFNQEEWPYADFVGDEQSKASFRENLIHSIGNLTLLTQSLNSSDSNSPFNIKRSKIAIGSLLKINSYFQNFRDEDKWDEKTIIERGSSLAKLALKIWEYPAK